MKQRHLALFHEERGKQGHVNVNTVHRQAMTFNDRIALRVSSVIGTMWFCYGLAAIMGLWGLLQEAILPALHIAPFDAYPFAFLFFCLGGIMQSLLMPLLLASQNLNNRHSELRAEAEYHIEKANAKRLDHIEERLVKMTGE